MNNPMMCNDPDGEFWWWLAGAAAGGYLNGVQANGSWNPGKWNWERTWTAVLGGALGGAAILPNGKNSEQDQFKNEAGFYLHYNSI